ncbi:MAG: hypothetical protein VXW22_02435 [Pseudomonadota bacterium]|nr:hypothetical protein [Pseudomonadota bacterium]
MVHHLEGGSTALGASWYRPYGLNHKEIPMSMFPKRVIAVSATFLLAACASDQSEEISAGWTGYILGQDFDGISETINLQTSLSIVNDQPIGVEETDALNPVDDTRTIKVGFNNYYDAFGDGKTAYIGFGLPPSSIEAGPIVVIVEGADGSAWSFKGFADRVEGRIGITSTVNTNNCGALTIDARPDCPDEEYAAFYKQAASFVEWLSSNPEIVVKVGEEATIFNIAAAPPDIVHVISELQVEAAEIATALESARDDRWERHLEYFALSHPFDMFILLGRSYEEQRKRSMSMFEYAEIAAAN